MTAQTWALIAAGIIGCIVAIVHGTILNSKVVKPIMTGSDLPNSMRRLFPLLMQFSTICWFFGGLVLIAAPFLLDRSATLTSAVFVGVFYLIGAAGNFWGTKGKHPGWVLLAIAVALIGFAISQ